MREISAQPFDCNQVAMAGHQLGAKEAGDLEAAVAKQLLATSMLRSWLEERCNCEIGRGWFIRRHESGGHHLHRGRALPIVAGRP